jgi:hypothetical protein
MTKPLPATAWRPYADRWYRDVLTCTECGKVKPAEDHPTGWWRRYRPKERRTEVHCPQCHARRP